jgi:hypothetical protein
MTVSHCVIAVSVFWSSGLACSCPRFFWAWLLVRAQDAYGNHSSDSHDLVEYGDGVVGGGHRCALQRKGARARSSHWARSCILKLIEYTCL